MSARLDVQDLAVLDPQGRHLVREVSFSLHDGEALTLLGESGSGKSLLAQAVMDALPAGLRRRGQVQLQGGLAWGRSVALLPQEPWAALSPLMTAEQQVAEVHQWVADRPAAEALGRARQDLQALDLGSACRRRPFELSGGMAQRVAFAASTAAGAPLLVADEPTKGLDRALRDQVVALLQRHVAASGARLVITHDIEVARALGGRVAIMQAAEWLEHGPTAQVLERPQHRYTRALLAAEPARWPRRGAGGDTQRPLLQARDLGKRFGPRTIFQGVQLDLHGGQRLALTGPSGCGKTTLGNVLLGLLPPDQGRVQRAPGLARTALQKLYQDPLAAFAPRVALARGFDDLRARHQLPTAMQDEVMQRLQLAPALLQRRPAAVSGGELQRLALARVLMLRPALLFADEPTSRLDPLIQQQTFELLHEQLAAEGAALLLVTHDAELAAAMTARQIQLG